jgi:hypothetical protein
MLKINSLAKTGLFGAVLLSLSACSWVKPIEGASRVDVMYAYEVVNCEKLGGTTTSVRDKVGFIERDAGAIRGDLTKLAQNEAIRMGGDTIVATTPPVNGAMSFNIYRCRPANAQVK